MSIAEKLTTIAENTPKVFNAGYEKGKAEGGTSKPEQEKTIEITENGTTEVSPDENKVLSKVIVEVDVPSNDVFSGLISGLITEVVVPENITNIRSYAFSNCSKLAKVVLHEKITNIGYSAFYLCWNLTSLTLPASITTIDATAIQRCDNMVNLTVNCVIKSSFYLNYAKNLTPESVDSVINALADLTGKNSQTVLVHSEIVARLTQEQYMVVESKNWIIR